MKPVYITTTTTQVKVSVAYMRGEEPDGAAVQLCLAASGRPEVALDSDVSEVRLSEMPGGAEEVSDPAAATTLTSPSDAEADADAAAVSDFLDDKSITSGSHNFFT